MKKIFFIIYSLLLCLTIPNNAYAMHIAEGFLPLKWCLFYSILVIPFLYLGLKRLKRMTLKNKEIKILLGVMAAFVFMMSALKLPSITGSSSHPTGTGIGAIIFGPVIMPIISFIVLLFQALLLAHGGITTLGANLLSMGIIGPFVAYSIYQIFKNKNELLAVGIAAALGDLSTYVVTSIQLGISFPGSINEILVHIISFMGIFAVTQVPLAIIEGILSVIIYDFIKKHCALELSEIMKGI